MSIETCGIIGLGLMGGSLGLALRSRGVTVLAVEENPASLRLGLERGAADRGGAEPSILRGADLVVICTPPRAIVDAAARALPHLKHGCLLADFGSVKAPIVEQIEPLLTEGMRFVGLHPMCGTAAQGIEAARPDLFAGAALVATPTERTPASALADAGELASLLGMRLMQVTPKEHDRQVALLSHVPYLLSIALTRLAPSLEWAGPSFRDATRVAQSPPALWEEILSLNHSQVIAAADLVAKELRRLGDLQGERLKDALEQVQRCGTASGAAPGGKEKG